MRLGVPKKKIKRRCGAIAGNERKEEHESALSQRRGNDVALF